MVSPRALKKQKLFENMDEWGNNFMIIISTKIKYFLKLNYRSFFEENPNKGKTTKAPSKSVSVQTTQKNSRDYKLIVDKDPGKSFLILFKIGTSYKICCKFQIF